MVFKIKHHNHIIHASQQEAPPPTRHRERNTLMAAASSKCAKPHRPPQTTNCSRATTTTQKHDSSLGHSRETTHGSLSLSARWCGDAMDSCDNKPYTNTIACDMYNMYKTPHGRTHTHTRAHGKITNTHSRNPSTIGAHTSGIKKSINQTKTCTMNGDGMDALCPPAIWWPAANRVSRTH